MASKRTPTPAAQTNDADAEAKAAAEAEAKARAEAEAKAAAEAEAKAAETAEDDVQVRILRDQGEYRCGEVATLPIDLAVGAIKAGWADGTDAAVAQGYAESD